MGRNNYRQRIGEKAWKEYQNQRITLKVMEWRRRSKRKLIAYKGGKCQQCGFNEDCPTAYHFHHRDKELKKFGFSCEGRIRAWNKLKDEADKCDLLCSLCHAKLHDAEYEQSYQKTKERIQRRIREILGE